VRPAYICKLLHSAGRMYQVLANLAKRTPLYDVVVRLRLRRELAAWYRRGRSPPAPHLVKQALVADYAARFGVATLVETGTYMGTMVHAMRRRFQRIVSIELDPYLAERATRRFAASPHVRILRGDSAARLANVLETLTEPALFWLDAHYSGGITSRTALDTPVATEVRRILEHPVADRHVVLIDDARLFDGTHDYPSLDELRALVASKRPELTVEVADDVIRVHRPLTATQPP